MTLINIKIKTITPYHRNRQRQLPLQTLNLTTTGEPLTGKRKCYQAIIRPDWRVNIRCKSRVSFKRKSTGMVSFMVLTSAPGGRPLITSRKNCSFTFEWEQALDLMNGHGETWKATRLASDGSAGCGGWIAQSAGAGAGRSAGRITQLPG